MHVTNYVTNECLNAIFCLMIITVNGLNIKNADFLLIYVILFTNSWKYIIPKIVNVN